MNQLETDIRLLFELDKLIKETNLKTYLDEIIRVMREAIGKIHPMMTEVLPITALEFRRQLEVLTQVKERLEEFISAEAEKAQKEEKGGNNG